MTTRFKRIELMNNHYAAGMTLADFITIFFAPDKPKLANAVLRMLGWNPKTYVTCVVNKDYMSMRFYRDTKPLLQRGVNFTARNNHPRGYVWEVDARHAIPKR